MVKKYQILEIRNTELNTAGSKAVDDANVIAESCGYKTITVKCRSTIDPSLKERVLRYVTPGYSWLSAARKVQKGSIVFVQHNGKTSQLFREFFIRIIKRRNCKLISLVHDVEPLRFGAWKGDYGSTELRQLKTYSDKIIIHNNKMKQFFLEQGFEESKLITLEVFDYLTDNTTQNVREDNDHVVIAGNLDSGKAPYLKDLNKVIDINFGLYGPNYNQEGSNIIYYGSFPPEQLPSILKGKYGLVWDGDTIETCDGATGRYLRYNSPHKISLYTVSRIPIIIWDESAMADFVLENGIGITVHSLFELSGKISSVSDDEYNKMKKNIDLVAADLINGQHLKTALSLCEGEK